MIGHFVLFASDFQTSKDWEYAVLYMLICSVLMLALVNGKSKDLTKGIDKLQDEFKDK